MNTGITQEEISALKATKSENDWNEQCDKIKAARGGQYPPDWWPLVVMSGLMTEIQCSW
jgi:hypothetical protein